MSKIIKNTSLYTIGNVLPQLVGFILLPIYTEYLTPNDYGIVSSMQVLVAVLAVILTLALDRSIYRLYFDYKTEKEKKDYLGTITIGLFFISTSFLLLLFVFKGYVGQIYEKIEFYPYYHFAILTAFFTIFSIIPKIYFQVNEKSGKFVLISITQFTLNTCFVLWFVVAKNEGAIGMLKGNMVAAIVILPLFIYISIKIINLTFNFKILKETLSLSIPMLPGLFSAWILGLSDRIFIERYFNLHDVGIYGMSYKIAGLVLVFTGAFNLAYNPVFYKLANSENQIKAKKTLITHNNTFSIILICAVFLIILFSKEAIYFLLDSSYFESYKIVPIIGFAYLISQISGLFNLMIYQEKKVVKLMWIGLIGALLNIFFNFILIPEFGVKGAAFATVISFIIILLLSWHTSKKYYYIPLKWKQLGFILLPLVVIVVLFQYVFNLDMIVSLSLKSLMLIVILLIVIKKYSKELRLIIKNYKK